MSTVSPDTSRETATPLTDGCNNNRMVQLFSRRLITLSVSVLDDVVITSQVITQHSSETKLQLCLEWTQE